jgi:murein DD-endopeptidase MepM/ murein hydrolase activator NlpD
MPLLRDDVRATRQRQVLAGAALLVGGGIAFAATALVPDGDRDREDEGPAVPLAIGYSPPHDAGPEPPDAPASRPEPVVEEAAPGVIRTVHSFGSSSGFRTALTAAGLGGEEGDAITTALTGVLDFRRCRPEHQLVIERDGVGHLRRFEYRASITQVYEAVLDGSRWVGREVEVPIERRRHARGGVVLSTLGAALEASGLGRTLVGSFVETFEGRFDFNTQSRSGDAFRLLVDEERVNGTFLRWGTVWAIEYRSQRRGPMRAFWYERAPGEDEPGGDFHDETGRALHGGWLRTPLRYDHVSSPFDPRRMHPVLRRIMPHNGIDYAASVGTPVWAAAEGEVTWVGDRGANGNLVSLRHDGGYETFYAHLSRFASGLARGQTVRQRQVIGYVGSTGRSTGPHLHFGLKRHGAFVDPARELNGPGRLLPPAHMARFRERLAELRAALDAIPIPEVEVTAGGHDEPAVAAAPMDATD